MIGAIIAKRKTYSTLASLNRGDLTTYLSNWAENATFIYPGNLSVSGKIEGKKAIEQWFNRFLERFSKVNIVPKKVYVQNLFAFGSTNSVAVEWEAAVTDREGREFKNSGVTTINIEKGNIALVQYYVFDAEVLGRLWRE
jgi:ketosteroid isomerase-like protein